MISRVFSRPAKSIAILIMSIFVGALFLSTSCSDGENSIWMWLQDDDTPANGILLPKVRTSWHVAAVPYQIEGEAYVRGKLLWHTPNYFCLYNEIWDDDQAPGDEIVRTIRFLFRPAGSGAKSWAGVTTCLNMAIPDSMDYFDVRLYGDHGLVHIDFGLVNEDIDDDGYASTEDIDFNGVLDRLEDVGLDGIADGYGEALSVWGTNYDLAGDNWYFLGGGKCPFGYACDTIDWYSDEWFYEFLNGTEGNRVDPAAAGIPDRECLRTDRSMVTVDSYFSWRLDLSGDDFLVEGSQFNGWRTFRLPVRDSSAVGTVTSTSVAPTWHHIEHVRIWLEADESQTQPDTVEIADWRFISEPE